jgi:hypothetical protein
VTVAKPNPVEDQFRRIWDAWGKVGEKRARAMFLRQLVGSANAADLKVLRAALAGAETDADESAAA